MNASKNYASVIYLKSELWECYLSHIIKFYVQFKNINCIFMSIKKLLKIICFCSNKIAFYSYLLFVFQITLLSCQVTHCKVTHSGNSHAKNE